MVIFDQRSAGQTIHVDDVVRLGKIELRLKKKTDRLTLTGSGALAIHGAETIRNKYSTALIQVLATPVLAITGLLIRQGVVNSSNCLK